MRYSLEDINKRLKSSKMGVALRQRGDTLSLRATLPPRPDSQKTQAHQQDVALGMYANPAGFNAAEGKAVELASDIVKWKAGQGFPWGNWIEGVKPGNTCEYWIKAFKEEFLIKQQKLSTDCYIFACRIQPSFDTSTKSHNLIFLSHAQVCQSFR